MSLINALVFFSTATLALWLVVDDFRYRKVRVWVLSGLTLAGLIRWLLHEQSSDLWINLVLLACLGLGLMTYLSIKQKRVVINITHHLAWGDIWMIGILSLFSWYMMFLCMLMLSLVLALLIHLPRHYLTKKDDVPLVSYLGIVLLLFLVLELFNWIPELYNRNEWLKMLT